MGRPGVREGGGPGMFLSPDLLILLLFCAYVVGFAVGKGEDS